MHELELSPALRDHWERNEKKGKADCLREVILGGQDGLVNVLGLMLGIASATNDSRIAIIAGIAAAFAESVAMAAVAYTSGKAARDYYYSERERELLEIEELPAIEREEIKVLYMRKGFKGKELETMVNTICSDKKRWLDTMMSEELNMSEPEEGKPAKDAGIVGISSLIGSFIPVVPFFVLPVSLAMWSALGIAILVLFVAGAIKAKLTIGNWKKEGLEMAFIGTVSALIGYGVGSLLKV